MNTDIAQERCEPCRAGSPRLGEHDIAGLMAEVPAWRLEAEEGVPRLVRQFRFRAFADALAFTNRVGEIADAEGHHPAILTEYGRVTVSWWTHAIQGLHRNDFIMAAKTDALLAETPAKAA